MPMRPIRAAKFSIKKKHGTRKSFSKSQTKTPNQHAGAVYSFDLNDRVGGLAAVKSLYKTTDSDCPMGGVNALSLGYDYYDPTKTHSGGRRGKRSLRKSLRNRKSKKGKTQKRQLRKNNKNNNDSKHKTQRKSMRGGGVYFFGKKTHAKTIDEIDIIVNIYKKDETNNNNFITFLNIKVNTSLTFNNFKQIILTNLKNNANKINNIEKIKINQLKLVPSIDIKNFNINTTYEDNNTLLSANLNKDNLYIDCIITPIPNNNVEGKRNPYAIVYNNK